MSTQTKSGLPEGVVVADALYTMRELSRRLRLGHSALRLARAKGLKFRKIGRKLFAVGADVIAFMRTLEES